MKIIGVTGGIGSGKTTVCNIFKNLGARVIDADEIAHTVAQKDGAAYLEIIETFGGEILLSDGEIDRKALAKIVFSDAAALKKLNDITHKCVFYEMKKIMDEVKEPVLVLDVPLLFSCDFPFHCDLTLGVTAGFEERIKRVQKRDEMSREEIIKRINNQISDKELKEKADILIENSDLNSVLKQVENIFNRIRNE